MYPITAGPVKCHRCGRIIDCSWWTAYGYNVLCIECYQELAKKEGA